MLQGGKLNLWSAILLILIVVIHYFHSNYTGESAPGGAVTAATGSRSVVSVNATQPEEQNVAGISSSFRR